MPRDNHPLRRSRSVGAEGAARVNASAWRGQQPDGIDLGIFRVQRWAATSAQRVFIRETFDRMTERFEGLST
jgi:hypothetical protein